MINFKEIFIAWKTSFNPSESESKIAKDRLEICISCEYKKEVFEKKEWSAICGKCGCPLMKKVFSKEMNPCPMGYWMESDNKNGLTIQTKNKKSFL